MPRTSSLSKNTKQYIYGFLWLAIAVAVASTIHIISSTIPNQDIIIGAYNITQTTIVVTQSVTTYRVTTTIPSGNVLSISFPRSVTTARIEGTTGTTWSFRVFRDNNVWLDIWAHPSPQRVTYTFHYDRPSLWDIWYNNIPPSIGGADPYSGAGHWDFTVTVRPVGVVVVRFQNTVVAYPVITLTQTITTAMPTAITTATPVPAGNAVTISNRTFIEVIGFGACIAIMLNAITKVMKMRI